MLILLNVRSDNITLTLALLSNKILTASFFPCAAAQCNGVPAKDFASTSAPLEISSRRNYLNPARVQRTVCITET